MSTSPNICEAEYSGHRLGAKDAQRIGAALADIERRSGELTPELVVKAARPKRSPLHGRFTWDDSEAARAYRLVQAAWLIRTVKVRVIIGSRPAEARAFVRVVKSEATQVCDDESEAYAAPQSSYVHLSAALENPTWRGQMMDQALRELDAFRRKYAVLEELQDIMQVIERKLAKVA